MAFSVAIESSWIVFVSCIRNDRSRTICRSFLRLTLTLNPKYSRLGSARRKARHASLPLHLVLVAR